MGLLLDFLNDILYLNQEYKKSSVELLVYLLIEMRNMSRSSLWSSWFLSSLISYPFYKEYEQKSFALLASYCFALLCFAWLCIALVCFAKTIGASVFSAEIVEKTKVV